MRRQRKWAVVALALASGSAGLAQPLTNAPPAVPAEANPPVIDSFVITGATRFSDAQLKAALTQHVGDKVHVENVQADLRAIAALYASGPFSEQWSGFALVTPAVTVTPDISHPAEGHVAIKYVVAEH